jgi:GNAT superfamily N-acetyltransferase
MTLLPIRTLVLVEGDSDAAAVRALADRAAFDLAHHGVRICAADGVTNFPRELAAFVRSHPGAAVCGLYDVADERHVRRALATVSAPVAADGSLEGVGFYACVDDLEDELIRALGAEAVERVIAAEGELASLRRFQAIPQHRGTPVARQLHRFLGTRATRKIRCAPRLVDALPDGRLPRPLALLSDRLREHCAGRVP